MPSTSGQRMSSGKPRLSLWRQGVWITRLSLIFGAFVIFIGIVNRDLLLTPVVEFGGVVAAIGAIIGLALSLSGLRMRSRRLKTGRFWTSVGGALVVLVALGFVYVRAYRSNSPRNTPMKLESPE